MSLEDIIGRQWQILQAFAERAKQNGGWTRQELADRFGVSDKTVDRDLKTLQNVFGNLRCEFEKHGVKRYFSDSKDFSFAPLNLNRGELLALCVAQNLTSPLRGTYLWRELESGRQKIAALLPEEKVRYAKRVAPLFYPFEPFSPRYDEKTARVLDAALVALEELRVLQVTYRSAKSETAKTYEFLPYTFLHWRGAVYLIGFSRKDQEIRTLKINRTTDATVLAEKFEPPQDFDVEKLTQNAVVPFFAEGGGTFRAKIRFKGVAAQIVREQRLRSIKQILEDDEDSLVVEMELERGLPSVRWAMGFGAGAIVLEPPELRDALVAELNKIIEKYKNDA